MNDRNILRLTKGVTSVMVALVVSMVALPYVG